VGAGRRAAVLVRGPSGGRLDHHVVHLFPHAGEGFLPDGASVSAAAGSAASVGFVKRSGFIAREGRTIPLNRISGVDFEVGVVDRIFGCGTLVVSDASEQGRVLLDDIPKVEQVQMMVADELHRLSSGERAGDGS